MILQELIDTFEELKKYLFVVERGSKGSIIIKFKDENFYHLVGLHKINIDMFFPNYIKSKDKKYKFIKKNIIKFNRILENQLKEKTSLEFRIKTFHNIIDLLKSNDKTILYDLKHVPNGSLYDGDYGLLKIYEKINCLLGLKSEKTDNNIIKCAPQSWMANNRINRLIENKKPIYIKVIVSVPLTLIPKTK